MVGENGSGKSTLLEAIAIAWGFNPEGGSRNFNFGTHRSHSPLSDFLTLIKMGAHPRDGYFLRAESFFNVATEIEKLDTNAGLGSRIIDAYGGKSLHEQSHGESFLALFQKRFHGNGLYILDEPEAALSPHGLMKLIVAIHQLAHNGSQFIIATHSPMLMAYPDAEIFELQGTELVKTAFRQTAHYQLTHRFLSEPERVMQELLGDQAN